MLAYSLFLRIEINQQVERTSVIEGNFSCFDSARECHKKMNKTTTTCESLNTSNLTTLKNFPWICHPNPDILSDSSRITFICIGAFFSIFFLVKSFWVFMRCKNNGWNKVENTDIVTVLALLLSVFFCIIAYCADEGNIRMVFPFNTLLMVPELFVFFVGLYLITCLVLKIICNNIWKDQIFLTYFKEPEELLQWFTIVAAVTCVVAVGCSKILGKTPEGALRPLRGFLNGTTALSVATGVAVLLIKIGQSSVTAFGNFATMFHIILRKIPAYFMAVLILLHGFSFGFWILETSLDSGNEERSFKDYWESGIFVFMMLFGLTEFSFEGHFKYENLKFTEERYITVMFAYILLALMVLLLCLGLLNLLLSTIITDHNQSKEEVIIDHLIFMAKYAIWMDFSTKLVKKICFCNGLRKCIDEKITKHIEEDYIAKLCLLTYCPKRRKSQGFGNWSNDNYHEDEHLEPHFAWVLKEIREEP